MATSNSFQNSRPVILWLGPLLVVAGVAGLIWAINQSATQTTTSINSGATLQVHDGDTGSANQGQTQAGSQLQGAAKVNDLIKGRDADDLQKGSAADALTKDATLQ